MQPDRLTASDCLFLDVDGTLIDIAPSPAAVVVPPSLTTDLRTIDEELEGAVALVSGRTIENLDALFHPLRLRASGVHGGEMRLAPDSGITMVADPLPADLWRDLLDVSAAFPRTLAENKAFSFALHYRAVPDSGPSLRRRLEDLVCRYSDLGLALMPGHYVFELKRPAINKGAAIERFLDQQQFRGRRPIFVGDDVTDLPGFEIVRRRGGLAYSVTDLVPGVDGTFRNPAAVRSWLSGSLRSRSASA